MTWIESTDPTRIVGVYRNVVSEPWQDEMHEAASRSDAFAKVFPPENWRVHLSDPYELSGLPSGVFGYVTPDDLFRERLEARTYCRELAVTPSEFYVTSEKSKIGLNLESSSEVMTERLDIIEALRRSCYRPRLSNFVVGLVLGYGWKGVDTRQLEYELGPLLPGTIKLQPLKIKTK